MLDTDSKVGRWKFKVRFVAWRGSKVHKSLSNYSDPTDGGNDCLSRDCSIAPILNQRRRLKAVLGVFDGITRDGVFPFWMSSTWSPALG